MALFGLSIMEMTVAGTAQELHLIPFYALVETPAHHHIACKDNVNQAKYKEKIAFFLIFLPPIALAYSYNGLKKRGE